MDVYVYKCKRDPGYTKIVYSGGRSTAFYNCISWHFMDVTCQLHASAALPISPLRIKELPVRTEQKVS